MVDPNSLAQDPAALSSVRPVKTGSLLTNSIALDEIGAVLRGKIGLWKYTNYCVIPVVVVKTANLKIGFQRGWVIANVFDPPRQFAAPLTEVEYQKISKALADCLQWDAP
jgi:hypothetical protein